MEGQKTIDGFDAVENHCGIQAKSRDLTKCLGVKN